MIGALLQRRAARRHQRLIEEVAAQAFRLGGEMAARQSPYPETGRPLIAIITPVYNTPVRYLEDLITSLEQQPAGLAELILVDDGSTDLACKAFLASLRHPRIQLVTLETNQGIVGATNAGIALARADWITFVDHDDVLAPHALAVLRAAIEDHPEAEFFFTDELITGPKLNPEDFFLKPAFDRVLLSGVNYINHLSVYRTDRVKVLGMREGYEGSQDYDLLLRYTSGLSDETIFHIPYPAYRWRRDGKSFSAQHMDRATDAARRAISQAFGNVPVRPSPIIPGLHRLAFEERERVWPKVSVIIANLNAPTLVRQVVEGLIERTDYPALQLVIVDNGSSHPDTLAFYRELTDSAHDVRIDIRKALFNFSRAVNRGAALGDGELILLINNDIEILNPDWLKEMVTCLDYGNVAVVGAKLLYPTRLTQHVGVMVGFGNYAGHWYLDQPADFPGPIGRLAVRQALTAVTGACFLTTRSCWDELGGFDETNFKIAYNDIDFCLRAREKGYRIIWTPFASLIHHESATRGSDETLENRERFETEKANLDRRHGTIGYADVAINPWYTTDRSYPVPRILTSLPEPRTNTAPRRGEAATVVIKAAPTAGSPE